MADNQANGDSTNQKRKRNDSEPTENTPMPSWITGASPPRFVSVTEMMATAKNLDKMALAHEIAINSEFELKPDEPPPEGTILKKVHDAMHKAFWDRLQEQINDDPPRYDEILEMVEEIRGLVESLLLPQHAKIRADLRERLDMQFLKQQLQHGVLQFDKVSNYILETMSLLCAPIRDEQIEALKKEKEIIPVLKGILSTLDLMKVDMANYTIASNKPTIQQHSVQYEREKFDSYIQTNPAGLRHTEAWLRRALQNWRAERASKSPASKIAATSSTDQDTPSTSNGGQCVEDGPGYSELVTLAYLELLEWCDNRAFPETLLVDQARLYDMRNECLQLVIVTSCVMLCSASQHQLHVTIDDHFKRTLKDRLIILLNDSEQRLLESRLPQVAAEVVSQVEKVATAAVLPAARDAMHASILSLQDPQQHVRKIIKDRIFSFVSMVVGGPGQSPIKLPPGLGVIQSELAKLTGAFLRLVSHNRAVFSGHYNTIIQHLLNNQPQQPNLNVVVDGLEASARAAETDTGAEPQSDINADEKTGQNLNVSD